MKALRAAGFGGPDVLKVETLPDPKAGEGEVLVRVRAVGVNPVDTYIRSGAYGDQVTPPYTPHSDGAGTIEAVGRGVKGWKKGDRVYTTGSTGPGWSGIGAELAVCRPRQIHCLPERLSFAQGAAINIPYATAHRALFGRAGAVGGETVLVHGASGGVGLAAVQIARARGLRVVGTAGTEKGRALVKEQGAHEVLDHSGEGYLDAVAGRVDVILEMASHLNLGKDLAVLAPRGRVVVIGCRGPVEINPRETMKRDAAVLGMALFNASPEEEASIHAELGAGFADGTLTPVVRCEMKLEQAAEAHALVLEAGALGKIVLTP